MDTMRVRSADLTAAVCGLLEAVGSAEHTTARLYSRARGAMRAAHDGARICRSCNPDIILIDDHMKAVRDS
jgi:hypothetical protein